MKLQRPTNSLRNVSDRAAKAVALPVLIVSIGSPAYGIDIEDAADRVHVGQFEDFLGWTVAALGDADGDGVNDYVVAALGIGPAFEGGAYVYSGATGALLHTLVVGDGAIALGGWSLASAGDVNNDGRDDIILGRPFSGEDVEGFAMVYSGATGDLLHAIQGGTPNALSGYSVAGAGDVNGDGYDDVLVGTPYANHIAVYSGFHGTPLLGVNGTNKFGYAMASLGDVNGNGKPDAAVSEFSAGRVKVIDLGAGATIRTIGGGVYQKFGRTLANAGDTDGDGVNDLLIGFEQGANLYSGATGALLHSFINHLGGAVGGAGDVNGDGYDDLIIGDSWNGPPMNGRVEIRSGIDGQLLRKYTKVLSQDEIGPSVAGLGDINGDGYTDLLVGASRAHQDAGAAYVVFGAPNVVGLLEGELSPLIMPNPRVTHAADLDRKKSADLLTVNGTDSQLIQQTNRGDGTFYFPKTIETGPNPTSIATLDIDRDGDLDVIVTCAGENRVRLYKNTGGTLTGSGRLNTGAWPSSVVAGDFNRDGHMDFAVANRDDDNVQVFLHNKSATGKLHKRYSGPKTFAVGDGPVTLIAARINGDAYLDLAVATEHSPGLSVLLNKKNGKFHPPLLTPTSAAPVSLCAIDANVDGFADLTWVDPDADALHVARGHGDGQIDAPITYIVGAGPNAVSVSDLNFDGQPDLIVANAADQTVTSLLNFNGQFGAAITVGVGVAVGSSIAADFDGDDDVDVAVSGGGLSFTTVLHNRWY